MSEKDMTQETEQTQETSVDTFVDDSTEISFAELASNKRPSDFEAAVSSELYQRVAQKLGEFEKEVASNFFGGEPQE